MDDFELVKKAQEGDKQSFGVLVERHFKQVISACEGILHHHANAQDVAQDVFIDAFKHIHAFKFNAKVSTWLYRMAVNKSLNYIRDNKKHKGIIDLSEKMPISLTSKNLGERFLFEQQRRSLVQSAINSLPENQKTAFILHKKLDLQHKDIAEVMNISISVVESLIHRAKKALQAKLIDYYKKNEI